MKTELQVPSDINFLTIVENWLLSSLEIELGKHIDWPRQSNRLRLVLAEAYSNVIRHAHKDKPHLPVLIRLEIKNNQVVKREKVLDSIGRVRNVEQGPDGYLYVGVEGKGILKIVPKS